MTFDLFRFGRDVDDLRTEALLTVGYSTYEHNNYTYKITDFKSC